MPIFFTPEFLQEVTHNGRLLEALQRLETLTAAERVAMPRLPKLSAWECVLVEVLDTDHDPPYYDRFVHELFCRGYSAEEIKAMRMIAWETAGWLNYEVMLWDWCGLNEDDMTRGLQNRFDSGDISSQRYAELADGIGRYRDKAQPAGENP